jgi:hypothetical protein
LGYLLALVLVRLPLLVVLGVGRAVAWFRERRRGAGEDVPERAVRGELRVTWFRAPERLARYFPAGQRIDLALHGRGEGEDAELWRGLLRALFPAEALVFAVYTGGTLGLDDVRIADDCGVHHRFETGFEPFSPLSWLQRWIGLWRPVPAGWFLRFASREQLRCFFVKAARRDDWRLELSFFVFRDRHLAIFGGLGYGDLMALEGELARAAWDLDAAMGKGPGAEAGSAGAGEDDAAGAEVQERCRALYSYTRLVLDAGVGLLLGTQFCRLEDLERSEAELRRLAAECNLAYSGPRDEAEGA